MPKNLLSIKKLSTIINDKEILSELDLNINAGETHVIMGANGAGKSTLARAIMGDPELDSRGKIYFNGEDISQEKTHHRARKGIFLSFQVPEEIPGISLESFLRSAKKACSGQDFSVLDFSQELYARMQALGMKPSYAQRQMNLGFSGGEKKKNEILQMELLQPKLAILDEIDSGLDVDAVKKIAQSLNQFKSSKNSLLIITHTARLADLLPVDKVHIMKEGRIVQSGGQQLISQIHRSGFSASLK